MGKFSIGMKKEYVYDVKAAFTHDDVKKQELIKKAKLSPAEALATLPFRLIIDPVLGAGALVGGIAVGAVCIPVGLVVEAVSRKPAVLEVGALALSGGLILGLDGLVVSPIVNIVSTPYNIIQAFRHRDKKKATNDIIEKDAKDPTAGVIETVENQSSHARMSLQLDRKAVNDANVNNAEPTQTQPLFEAKKNQEIPVPVQEESKVLSI